MARKTPGVHAALTAVGIDLGTSNSAIALSDDLEAEPQLLMIPQVTAPATVGEAPVLPSAIYLPLDGELEDVKMPWSKRPTEVAVGAFARERGALAPDRLVTSAKSWLCHGLVDRRGKLLPWSSTATVEKLSPIEASRQFLSHLKAAFEHGQKRPLAECRVVLTVPASFDEVARGLTTEAAEAAGLTNVTLLEEPQAAFYAWLAGTHGHWRQQVSPGELVLVVDVGGGTTDFSLIAVSQEEGNLRLERISVGEHLLLGGDNMDLALAYTLKGQLETDGRAVDAWQMLTLVHGARLAKERLLADDAPETYPVAVAGRGSGLFAGTLKTDLARAVTEQVIVDGFFPKTAVTDLPAPRRSAGIQEYGLPYVAEPAVTKHLARFLSRSLENVRSDERLSRLTGATVGTFLKPSAVLFNGGVFNAAPLRRRLLQVLETWCGAPVRELAGADHDLAVAKGAAYYALAMQDEKGIRIKAGTARSYYLGIEPSMPAVPGYRPPLKGLCVVPQGLEEGSHLELPTREFGLVTGEPVEFRFFSSAVRAGDVAGTVIENAEAELEETARLAVTLPSDDGNAGEVVPVRLDAFVTEVGTLELAMKEPRSDRKWNLEFNVRPDAH